MALLILLSCLPKLGDIATPGVTRSELPRELRGLSGLAVDDAGGLWSVTERDAALVPLRLEGDAVVAGAPLPIAGWPAGLDAESVGCVGPGRFLVGSEGAAGRTTDRVYEVRVEGGRAAVGRAWELDYTPFGVVPEENRGIEGLDATAGAFVAASEMVVGAPRAAPVWWVPLEGGTVGTALIELTSPDGKIAALVGTERGVLAIERHYGTSRLVEAELAWGEPETAAPLRAKARVVRDLAAELGELPNLEGLARLADGRIVVLSDNQNGRVASGATVALVLAAPAE